jgi:hypothetical protein
MTDIEAVLGPLAAHNVRTILVGGVAATIHGSARLTYDIDLVYDREPENIKQLVAALTPYGPYPRGAPRGLPFRWDAETIIRGLNFTLTTSVGDIDLFGEIVGGGSYLDLLPDTVTVIIFGISCRCLSVERLVQVKRAAGRPKDYEAIAELEALLDERRASKLDESDGE